MIFSDKNRKEINKILTYLEGNLFGSLKYFSYICTIIKTMRKSYNKFYSFLNSNPSLVLGADKVWDNLLKSRKTDYDGI